MQRRTIGGFDVSVVGLGCNNFGTRCDERQTAAVVDAAFDTGIDLFDTADVYGMGASEQLLGRCLKGRRDEVRIATKFGHPLREAAAPDAKQVEGSGGGSPEWIRRAVEGSLGRLGTDRIDLYQMHVPDESVPLEETLGALNDLVREGKVLEIGCSNYSGEQLNRSLQISADRGLAPFATAQNHYSLLVRDVEKDVLEVCEKNGVGMLPYFPLANGLLTGKYRRGAPLAEGTRLATAAPDRAAHWLNDRNFAIVEKLTDFAESRGRSILELAMSWLAARPSVVSVIAGATKPEQVRANSSSVEWTLSAEEVEEVDRITSE